MGLSVTSRLKKVRLSDACHDILIQARRPLVTRYDILLAIGRIVHAARHNNIAIYAFKPYPTKIEYTRVVSQLTHKSKLATDEDFPAGIFRINRLPDVPAEDACCLVDRFCYISHLSAMQHYGLTDRIPDALTITRAAEPEWKELASRTLAADLSGLSDVLMAMPSVRLQRHTFPAAVRGRRVVTSTKQRMGRSLRLRDDGRFVRIARLEQTFLDMLTEPDMCGGMPHVIEVWRTEAPKYLERIITAVDQTEQAITKVRAGFILDELMGLQHDTVHGWRRLAQRGGSRKLDPSREYRPVWSESWMLSLNTDIPQD